MDSHLSYIDYESRAIYMKYIQFAEMVKQSPRDLKRKSIH